MLLCAALPLLAQAPAETEVTPEQFEAGLHYQTGSIPVKGGLATLNLPAGYRFLGPEDAQRVLVEAWGNPPGESVLGMVFPPNTGPFSETGWGVIVEYSDDGYVDDEEAQGIDYAKLLGEMQEATREENSERVENGYEAVELVGWAASPHYDAASQKLYWAKELKFGDTPGRTLNYDIRVLGRRGVLSLNAVAALEQLPQVERGMQELLGFVEFNQGHRYADFVPGTDRVAAYGIGALVAGQVAAKAGFFKLLLGGLIAMKKFVILAFIGAAAFLRRLLGREKAQPGSPGRAA